MEKILRLPNGEMFELTLDIIAELEIDLNQYDEEDDSLCAYRVGEYWVDIISYSNDRECLDDHCITGMITDLEGNIIW